MFGVVAGDFASASGIAFGNTGMCTAQCASYKTASETALGLDASAGRFFQRSGRSAAFCQRVARFLPMLCLTGFRLDDHVLLSFPLTKTRPSPGADRLRAARLHVWAWSPRSYLSALTTNPVELRARRGRCRFGPPAAFTCSRHTRPAPGKSPHGVYRHEPGPNSTEN